MAQDKVPLNNDSFSLVPAIFIPFHGINKDKSPPKDRISKLRRILDDLDKHHDAVRRNMIYLLTLQKEKLLSNARDALEKEKAREIPGTETGREKHDPELQQEFNELLENLREPAVRGTSGKEYEYDEGDFDTPKDNTVGEVTDADGDTAMSGVDIPTTHTRNIYRELYQAIQDLVQLTAAEIELYDKQAETTKDYYRRALARHNAREGLGAGDTTEAISATPATEVQERRPGGILRRTTSEIHIDIEAMARIDKEEGVLRPTEQAHSATDISRDSRKNSVEYPQLSRKNSVQFALDPRRPPRDGSKDIWRR